MPQTGSRTIGTPGGRRLTAIRTTANAGDDAVDEPPEGAGDKGEQDEDEDEAEHQALRSSGLRGRGSSRMRGPQALERALGGLPFGAFGRNLDHLLPRLLGTVQILLAEGAHDADVQQRLRVLRVDLQRLVELLQRPVRLVRVVVRYRRARC